MNKRVIDLSGPCGNAFALLAYARNFSDSHDVNFSKVKEEMMSGNYENLVKVFEFYFGEYVEIVR